MALITIERIIPAPVQSSILLQEEEEKLPNNGLSNTDNILSEIYIAVRGADIIFPYNECHRFSKSSHKAIFNDIQKHLQAIFKLLRPQDKMKMAIRLESQISSNRIRYLLVVSNGTDESCLLGIDYEDEATIGLVLAIWNDMQICLDGDGGFRITSGTNHHIFKPVSVQAMWSAFQALHLASKKSVKNNYFENGGSHSWVSFYRNRIKSNSFYLHEWHTITDPSETTNKIFEFTNKPIEQTNFEELITSKLKKIMMSVDLDQVTSKEVRNELEAQIGSDLTKFKSYIDKELIRIMGQMDESSKILDYLYLGSEWNASNFEELKGKGVKKILNVTCEIDNFFPGCFEYYNIRVLDDEGTDMLRYLNDTYYYIRKAKDEGSKVLVHCKKGISRSASVVVAYIMKEKSCDLYEALEYVKNLRSNIRPNPEFLKQLEIYQGMLNASNNKARNVWRSNSESDLNDVVYGKKSKGKHCDNLFSGRHKIVKQDKFSNDNKENKIKLFPITHRRRSWPPKEVDDSNYILFQNNKKNRFHSRRSHVSTEFFFNDDSDMENFGNEMDKSTFGSRVKEKIEGFENFKQSNKKLNHKKNVAKNGLVSNLACQFESKDKEAMNDLSNLEQYNRNGFSKPPILLRSVKAVNENLLCDLDQLDGPRNDILTNELVPDMTLVFKCLSTKSEYSSRILKRTLSCDNILNISKNMDSSDVSLKKCKKSFHQFQQSNEHISNRNVSFGQLRRTLSLPNIVLNSANFKRKMIENYTNLLVRQTYLKSAPLDLHYFRTQISNQLTTENDGFVKRRTEQLEQQKPKESNGSRLNKSRSMPSSPNFNLINVPEKVENNDKQLKHSLSTKSFDFPLPTTAQTLIESGNNKMSDKNICYNHANIINCESKSLKNVTLKKTYGRSHPLDMLHRNNK